MHDTSLVPLFTPTPTPTRARTRPLVCALACTLALVTTTTTTTARATAIDDAPRCTPEGLFADVRTGMKSGSPALRGYMSKLLAEAALVLPSELLLRELAREDDPAMIEALGAALVVKAENSGEPGLVKPLLQRAIADSDPARRAAAVRALRGSGSVELMAANGGEIDYARLVTDHAPEVRAAVVDNLVTEDTAVYSGHSETLAEAALQTAHAAELAEDPASAAAILRRVSTEAVGPDGARALTRTLEDDDATLRAAAAKALGGLSPASARAMTSARAGTGWTAVDALVAQYRRDDDLGVRRAILESIARLERVRAIPTLEGLRSVDARLDAEITAWIAVLQRGLPEWALIVREKQ